MKKSLLILLSCAVFYFPGISQSQQLPEAIQHYYKNKNYLSFYSFKSEREYLNCLYLKGGNIDSISNPRLKQIAYLLFSTWGNYYHIVSFNGGRSAIPSELILPTVYTVDKWERDGKAINVTVRAYTVKENLIHELIGNWDDSCSPANKVTPGLKDHLVYMYRETQHWIYQDGRWITASSLFKLIN